MVAVRPTAAALLLQLLCDPGTGGVGSTHKGDIVQIFTGLLLGLGIILAKKQRTENKTVGFRIHRVKGQHPVIQPDLLFSIGDIFHAVPQVQNELGIGKRFFQQGKHLFIDGFAFDHHHIVIVLAPVGFDDTPVIGFHRAVIQAAVIPQHYLADHTVVGPLIVKIHFPAKAAKFLSDPLPVAEEGRSKHQYFFTFQIGIVHA